jgi:valyl-tRNA synthetase
MAPDGTMNELAGEDYKGMDRFACRKKIVEKLTAEKLLINIEDIQHSVGHCYRCKTVVEPYLSKQWFVKAKPLAEPALQAVRDGTIKIVPEFWEKTYYEWMENIRDWCISRQIWWGHQIPAWTCSSCSKMIVAREAPVSCPECEGQDLVQETDVLDTWFSSALWPFSTLGWPEETASLKKYYPTSVLCTGFDILFFWVARMIMMGIKIRGEIPFDTVYLVIDPLVMMDQYGTDALRFTLAAFAAQGRDIKLAEDRIEGYRNFCNKLWNASRFAFMNLEDYQGTCELDASLELSVADRWILSRLNQACQEVNEALEAFKFNDAASAVYKFIWNEFCDWYIELSKSTLFKENPLRKSAQNVLVHVLETSLKMLHPFMPFITEEIWQKLPRQGESIMKSSFPKYLESRSDRGIENKMNLVMGVITSVRNIRGEMNLNPALRLALIVRAGDTEQEHTIRDYSPYIRALARVEHITIDNSAEKPKVAASSVFEGIDIIVPLEGMMDFEEEKNRIEKELKKIEKDIIVLDKKLSNKNFVQKAPPEVIEKDRQRLSALTEKKSKLQVHLKTIEQAV